MMEHNIALYILVLDGFNVTRWYDIDACARDLQLYW